MASLEPERWDTVIVPRRGIFDLRLGELWRYRDLVALLLRRNLVVNYRQTLLGPVWYIVQPVTATIVYTVVFGMIARVPTDNISPVLFYLSGVVVWTSFASNVVGTSDIFATNMAVFGKVYFPRLAVPLATVLSNLVTSALQLTCFFLVIFVEVAANGQPSPSVWAIACPALFIVNGLFAMGIGLLCSALTTRYRDLIPIVGAGLQLWMYATPIIYPLSQIPAEWRLAVALNPLATSVEMFRVITLGAGSVSIAQVATSLSAVVVTLITGIILFSRAEQNAADTV